MNIYILQISLSFFLGPSTCRASITVLLALSNPDSMTTLKQSSLWSLLILINLSQLRRSLSLLFRRRQKGIRAAEVIGVEIQYPSSPNTESQWRSLAYTHGYHKFGRSCFIPCGPSASLTVMSKKNLTLKSYKHLAKVLVGNNDKLTLNSKRPFTRWPHEGVSAFVFFVEPISGPKNNELEIYPSTVEATLLPSALYFGGEGNYQTTFATHWLIEESTNSLSPHLINHENPEIMIKPHEYFLPIMYSPETLVVSVLSFSSPEYWKE